MHPYTVTQAACCPAYSLSPAPPGTAPAPHKFVHNCSGLAQTVQASVPLHSKAKLSGVPRNLLCRLPSYLVFLTLQPGAEIFVRGSKCQREGSNVREGLGCPILATSLPLFYWQSCRPIISAHPNPHISMLQENPLKFGSCRAEWEERSGDLSIPNSQGWTCCSHCEVGCLVALIRPPTLDLRPR